MVWTESSAWAWLTLLASPNRRTGIFKFIFIRPLFFMRTGSHSNCLVLKLAHSHSKMKLISWATLLSLAAVEAAVLYNQPFDSDSASTPFQHLVTVSGERTRFEGDKVVEACMDNLQQMKSTLDMIDVSRLCKAPPPPPVLITQLHLTALLFLFTRPMVGICGNTQATTTAYTFVWLNQTMILSYNIYQLLHNTEFSYPTSSP